MSKIASTEELVKEILIRDIESRSNDFRLYKKVLEETLNRPVRAKEFAKIILDKEYRVVKKLPGYLTIERNRRKVFEKNEWLKPIKVTKARENLEEEFETYSRED